MSWTLNDITSLEGKTFVVTEPIVDSAMKSRAFLPKMTHR